ncbi:MAG: thioesterase family protein, partial [Acidobacteria bacterium]|nr:thioesterase family protein [Acidobacteriota bacterium]
QYTNDRVDFVHNFSFRRQETTTGESVSWLRLNAEFVEGETASDLQRLTMIADMIPSAGALFDFEKYLSVNPDLSVTIHRLPTGPWIGQRSVVRTSAHGTGQTDGQLFDERGSLGRSIKSLLIDER